MTTHERLRKAQQAKVKQLTDPASYAIDYSRPLGPQYKNLVHKANLRIDKLMKLSKFEGYKNVKKWSLANLIYSAKGRGYLTKTGKISSKIPETEAEIQKRIKALQTFLSSITSTKVGINELYQKRADTINERYGTNFTWQDIGTYFESGISQKYDEKYGSKTALKAIGEIQKQSDLIQQEVKQHKAKTIRVDDSELQTTVDQLLKDRTLTRLGLY